MKNSPAEGTLKKLVSGTAVLTAAAVITKIIGLFYKIPLIKYVGIEGMAYFLAANHIYVFLFVISTSGLPVAVSIMVAEAMAGGERERGAAVFRAALYIFLLVGAAGTLFMLAAAESIAGLINIGGAARCITAIAPAILMACVCGAYRGYFQGCQIMRHTALSQVIESLGKLFLGIAGALFAVRRGYDTETVAAFAIAGITAGVGLAMLYLAAAKVFHDRRNKTAAAVGAMAGRGPKPDTKDRAAPHPKLAGRLLKLALPITLSSAVISLTGLIDTTLIANCLSAAGFSGPVINKLYSCYGNIAVPLFSLTPALIAPVSVASVPLVSAALKSGDREGAARVAGSAFRLTFLAALPASAGLSVFAAPIIRLIFPRETEAAEIAAPLLSLLALSVVTACLITTTGAMLQARGRAGRTIISMLAGALVKVLSEYLLISNPAVNIAGAPISTFLCNLTVVALNIYFLSKYMPASAYFGRAFLSGGASALAAVGGAALVLKITGETSGEAAALLPAFAAALIIYIIMIFITRAATPELLGMLPGGGKLAWGRRVKKSL